MLALKTFLGVGWSISARMIGRMIDFVTLLVLARVLGPADFGLTALAMTLIVILETVLEIPLTQALTRLRHVEKSHLDTAFTLGLLRGLVFSAIVAGAAWPFSKIYSDPRLLGLLMALSLGPIARGFYSPGMVRFFKELRFREVFITQVVGKLLAAGLSVLVLYLGGGYWAIVTNTVVASAGATLISYLLAPYRPALSLAKFREFSGFLGWFSCGQAVSAVNWQFDRVLLGNFLSKEEFGKYTMAGDIAALPTQSLIGPAMQPLISAFSNINDDFDRMKKAYLKASYFTMMLAMPVCVLMSVCADLIISLILNDRWRDSAIYLRWLSLTIVLNAYFQPLYSLSIARDKPKYIFYLNALDLLFRLVLIPVGIYYYSVLGVIGARGVIAVVVFAASLYAAKRLIGAPLALQLRNLSEIAVACCAMAASVLLLRDVLSGLRLPVPVEFVAVSGCAAVVYVGVLLALGVRLTGLMRGAPRLTNAGR